MVERYTLFDQQFMKTIYQWAVVAACSLFTLNSIAQTPEIGTWVDYLPYTNVEAVVETPDMIYGSTGYSLVQWNKDDNSLERFSKVHGLSDIGVSSIDYHENSQTLMVGYSNGNLDLIRNNRIINFADIKRSNIVAEKSINNILFKGDTAYLSCGFGIVLFSMSRDEIIETYVIGETGKYLGVNDLVFAKDTIFTATDEGIYFASASEENLKFYGTWDKFTNIPNQDGEFDIIQYFGGKILANFPVNNFTNDTLYWYGDGVWEEVPFTTNEVNRGFKIFNDQLLLCHSGWIDFLDTDFNSARTIPSYNTDLPPGPNEAIVGSGGIIWVADRNQGIVKSVSDFNNTPGVLTSPNTISVEEVSFIDDNVWVAAGTRVGLFDNAFNFEGVYRNNTDREWTRVNRREHSILDSVVDIVSIAGDPRNNGRLYAASLGTGIIEFENNVPVKIYDHNNSPLGSYIPSDDVKAMKVKFDTKGNMWALTNRTKSFLTVKTRDDEWFSFDFTQYFSSEIITRDFIVTKDGMAWVVLDDGKGILVFDPKGTFSDTTDDQVRILRGAAGSGGIHNTSIHSIVEDLDGEIWIGTAEGVAVFFSPSNVFSANSNIDAQRIFVTVNGFTQYLLETEVVKTIAVDGANRKWFGTEKTGAFLMSQDGTEQLFHFTAENSPIFSNQIKTINVNPSNGEVFIGSDKGLQAYKGTATAPDPAFGDVYAYPNPVKEDYFGYIAVKGLARDANVKITDINGNLVFETYSEGGQAVWNGQNMNGDRVATGVYLVFAADSDGEEKEVTKILFIH